MNTRTISNMKYLLTLTALFLVMQSTAQQQKDSPVKITGTPAGIYITLPNPDAAGFTVLRDEDNKGFQPAGSYQPVQSASDLYRRMASFTGVFPNYQTPSRAFADTIWNRYQTDRAALADIDFPLMQLSIGNAFLDTMAAPGKSYQYKIVFPDTKREFQSAPATFTPDQPVFGKMVLSSVKNVGQTVRLEWAVPVFNAPPFFELYRKQSASKDDFKKIPVERGTYNSEAGDSTIFLAIDTTSVVGISYDYFLTSVDFLGNEGNHSDTVRLQVGGRQNVPSVQNLGTRSDSAGIYLTWRALQPNPSLDNILLLRSEHYDSGYSLLTTLPVTQVGYLDRSVEGGKLYYYQLIVEGSANYSVPTPRTSGISRRRIALEAPHDLQSRSIDKGIALSWRYRDTGQIKGFKVYRSNYGNRGFEFIGEMVPVPSDTTLVQYLDTTIANDRDFYYYAVTAVSNTSNEGPSSQVTSEKARGMSATPAPTRLRSLWLNDSTVSITWLDMQRQTPGVTGYKVYKGNEQLSELSDENLLESVDVNELVDTLRPGQTAWYWVRAEGEGDAPGSISSPIRVQAAVSKPLAPEVHLYKQKKSVVLSWEPALSGMVKRYNIYRGLPDKDITLLGSLEENGRLHSYSDTKVKTGQIYYYYVTTVDEHNIESDLSKELFVRF